MEDFFAPLGGHKTATVYCKSTKFNERTNRSMDKYALLAWVARVSIKAKQSNVSVKYTPGIVDDAFLKKIAQTSRLENGPIIAKNLLEDAGIPLIVEPHLPRTYIDGAAILSTDDKPIIALTIRHDRLDNFWHTLLHELAHVSRHLKKPYELFVDDLDSDLNLNKKEIEADALARNSFMPRKEWERSDVFFEPSEQSIHEHAKRWMIHPSIIAGRIRYETRNYYRFRQFVGYNEVRSHFPGTSWQWASNKMNANYLPILKAREGELKALSQLNASTKGSLTPLIDIPRKDLDKENGTTINNLESHIVKVAKNIRSSWGNEFPFYMRIYMTLIY